VLDTDEFVRTCCGGQIDDKSGCLLFGLAVPALEH
jgi:hypothetical protein